MSFVIAPIVEGHGDVAALPVLLRRMAPMVLVARPVRFKRSQLVQQEHLIRAAKIADANIAATGAVLVIMDADEDCAASLGPQLETILRIALPHRLCRVALAVREFEAWIVGGHASYSVDDPDRAGRLEERIKSQRGVYKKSVDQPRLIADADLARLAGNSRSFRRLHKVVNEFIALAG